MDEHGRGYIIPAPSGPSRTRWESISLSVSLLVERERERDREVGGTKGIQEKKRAEEFWPFANGTLPRFFLAYNANPSTLGPNNSVEPVRPTWKRDTYATLSLSLSLVSLFATPVRSPPAFSRLCSFVVSTPVSPLRNTKSAGAWTRSKRSIGWEWQRGPLRNSGEISWGIYRIDVIVSHSHRLPLKVGYR